MTAAQVCDMTPRHFAAIWTLYLEQEERAERRTAMQLCQIANLMRDTKEHPAPFTLEDFMGHNGSVPSSRASQSTTGEQIDFMRSMFEAIKARNEAMSDQGVAVAKGYITPRARNDAG